MTYSSPLTTSLLGTVGIRTVVRMLWVAAIGPSEGVSKVIQTGASRRSMRWVIAMYTQDPVVSGKAS